ncbi:1-acyl-sn-glycerol-3-phosphate acyltransferase [Mucilaginibacter antarcticus]|uniref:1-acyl-sn-glycerol-3-phosphate acyltransferase n=1 Tax=Mucilaginibacter antarcticus TaxID=1855725 RepID=A0ABW5XRS7_9SPHI
MIYPKQNIILKTVFNIYVRWLTARHFHQINYNQIDTDSNRSILLIANHFSVWDTFVLYHINRYFFKRKFHAMVLEGTILKEPMLSYGGAFSVSKSSKGILQSLDFAAELLGNPGNLVLIYPQGKLYSNLVSEVIFEQGVIRIIAKAAGKFNLVFATTFIENFENFKPVANVYLKAETQQDWANVTQLQSVYQQQYTTARQQQTKIIK